MGALFILGFTGSQYPSMTVIGIIVKNRQYLTQNVVSRSGCLVTKDVTLLSASREINPSHSAVCVTQLSV